MATLGLDTGKIILARAGDVTSKSHPAPGDPHELILCVELKTIDIYGFHVPLRDVIDETKAHCLKWVWTESKEWPKTLAVRLEEAARGYARRCSRASCEPQLTRTKAVRLPNITAMIVLAAAHHIFPSMISRWRIPERSLPPAAAPGA